MQYTGKVYLNEINYALNQGHEILERLENSSMNSSLLKSIDSDFMIWKTNFISYLKKYFSIQCREDIGVFEQSDICDVSNVKSHLSVLRQIRNGILEEMIFPDSYLEEKDRENQESREFEFLERRAYRLSKTISQKMPTVTVCFILSVFTCITTMFLLDSSNFAYHKPVYQLLGTGNIIISLLCAATIGVLCYLIIFSIFTTSLNRIESRLKSKEKERQPSIKIEGAEIVNISDSVQNRLFEEMPGRISEAVINEIKKGTIEFQDRSISFFESNTSKKPSAKSDEGKKFFRTQMRELFHSLATPISAVNRSLKIINASKDDEDFSEVLNENLDSIQNSVIYIDALLDAYRNIAMQNTNSTDSKVNLKQFVLDTVRSLSIQANKTIHSKVDGELSKIDGFESQYIVALLLPLLQNAVEASPTDNDVELTIVESEDKTFIEIKNTSSQTVKTEDLLKDNFTTKGDFHEGLGLSTVRHIANERNVLFEISAEANMITAKLGFPQKIQK